MKLPSSRVLELVIAVSVVIISVASLFVALYQGRVMEQTMQASVMPLIQASTSNYDAEKEDWVLRLEVRNTGLGPARIHYLRLVEGDQPVEQLSRWVADCCTPPELPAEERLPYAQSVFAAGELILITETFNGRYLSPQEIAHAYQIDRPDREAQPRGFAMWQALDSARFDVEIEICYCSVFDQCWRARFRAQEREEVYQCVVPRRAPAE